MSKRRGKGEGSIHKRTDGIWVAVLELPHRDGKRRRKYLYGPDKSTVKLALAREQLAIVAGDEPSTRIDHTTVGAYLERWLAGVEVKPRTLASYTWIVEKHLRPHIGSVPLREFDRTHVGRLKSALASVGSRTRQLAFVVLRAAVNAGIATGSIARSPLTGIPAPRYERREMQTWNAAQAQRVLAAARDDRFFALYVVALRLGLQFPGEILGLRWADVDLKNRVLTIGGQLASDGTRASLKTTARRRRLDLPQQAVDALRAHQEKLLAEGLRSSELVFPNQLGKPQSSRNFVRDSFDKVIERAGRAACRSCGEPSEAHEPSDGGIAQSDNRAVRRCEGFEPGVPRIRPYDMRHTFATLALLAGVHVKIVSEILGHANVVETLRTYSHVLPTMQRDAIDRLDALWNVDADAPVRDARL